MLEVLHEWRVVVLVAWLGSLAWLAWGLLPGLLGTASRSQSHYPSRGGSTDGSDGNDGPQPQTDRLADAREEHLRKGQAITVRVDGVSGAPTTTPSQRSTRIATKADTGVINKPSASTVQKVTRMEELGFHVGVMPIETPAAAPAPAPAPVGQEPAMPIQPAEVHESAAIAPLIPATERLQTQDLDSILARIEAVLSDTAIPAPAPSARIAALAPKAPSPEAQPPTEKVEAPALSAARPPGAAQPPGATKRPGEAKPLAEAKSLAEAQSLAEQPPAEAQPPADAKPPAEAKPPAAGPTTATPLWARPNGEDRDLDADPAKPGDQQRLF